MELPECSFLNSARVYSVAPGYCWDDVHLEENKTVTKTDTKLLKSSSVFQNLEEDVTDSVKAESDRYTIDGVFHMTSVVDKGERDIIDMIEGFDFSRTPDLNFASSKLPKSPDL